MTSRPTCHREFTKRSPLPTFVIASPLWGRSDLHTPTPVIASLRSDLHFHPCHRELAKRSPLPHLRLLHCVRNDIASHPSSRVYEAISNPTPLRLLHCVRNDIASHLSSRVYEALSITPLRLLTAFAMTTHLLSSRVCEAISTPTPEIASLRSQ